MNTVPERTQSTEHRTQSTVEGIPSTSDRDAVIDTAVASIGAGASREESEEERRERPEQDDQPAFDPIFGGLGAHQRIMDQCHEREEAATLA